ncbi:MAG TPA: 50S ribosomal protein L20 [Phycisphaerae bacterium]|nr:50S ribosomal protein L20 [Phycisphaerae bacterium]
MPRVRSSTARHRKHKKVLKAASGYYSVLSRRYKLARQEVFRAGVMATRDRQRRKRDFRRLWITRISAACKQRGILYSRLIFGLGEANIALNRKMLSEIAIADPAAFDAVVEAAMKTGGPRDRVAAPAKA